MERRNWFANCVAATAIVGLLVVATWVPTYTKVVYFCQETASVRGYTELPGGIRFGSWQRASPLESWLIAHGTVPKHRWRKTFATGYNLLGAASFSCGNNDVTRLSSKVLTEWMRKRGDREIRALAATLHSGTQEEIRRKVDAICEAVHGV